MCGVVGIYSKDKDISKQLYYSLYSIQHRGQESCGLAVSNGEEINYYKDMGLVGDVFTPKKLEKLKGNMGLLMLDTLQQEEVILLTVSHY